MMRPLKALIRKDLLTYFHDRRAVVISFALPAALSLFFGFAFGASRNRKPAQRPNVPILVVDEDGSAGSRRLVQALAADEGLAAKPVALAEAEKQVKNGDISVAVVLPKGFGDAVVAAARGGAAKPEVRFLYDPSKPFQLAMVKGALHGQVIASVAPSLDPATLQQCAGLAAPYASRDEVLSGGETWDGAAHAVGGMAVQFILMGAIEAAVAILTDRQRGLWKRLRAAPLSRTTLLSSKILSGAIIAGMVLVWLFLFGRITMGVKIAGSPLGFVLVAASFALMASTLGVLVSTLGRTPQATRSVGIFVVLIAVMLGGAWFPAFLFPEWLQTVTKFVPIRWAVDGFDAMTWRGLGLQAALAPAGVLLASAVVFGAIAVLRFRWEE